MRETFDNLIDWFEAAIEIVPAAGGIDVAITEAELQADLDFGRDREVEEPEEPVLH